MKFALVVGHEAAEPGARAVAPLDCYEYTYNKSLAGMIACHLMDEGIQSEIFFRDKIGVHGAYGEVNAYMPMASIELHFNASDGTARGTETLFAKKVIGSERLAKVIHSYLITGLGRFGSENRGVKQVESSDRGYVNLTLSLYPSILIEPFFGDNVQDSMLGLSQKEQLSLTISRGIAAYMRNENALN